MLLLFIKQKKNKNDDNNKSKSAIVFKNKFEMENVGNKMVNMLYNTQ